MGKVQGIALRGGVLRLQTLVLHSVQGGGWGSRPPPLIQGRYDAPAWVEDVGSWASDAAKQREQDAVVSRGDDAIAPVFIMHSGWGVGYCTQGK